MRHEGPTFLGEPLTFSEGFLVVARNDTYIGAVFTDAVDLLSGRGLWNEDSRRVAELGTCVGHCNPEVATRRSRNTLCWAYSRQQ